MWESPSSKDLDPYPATTRRIPTQHPYTLKCEEPNKRRLRVAKTLESWGYRIQESVFQLRLDTATLARVRSSLAALISDSEDVIHIYPICSSCADRADILGAAIALDDVGLCRGVW